MNNIISTKARVFRNVKDYKFVSKLSNEQKEEISEKLKSVLTGFSLINIPSADAKIAKVLIDNNLIGPKTTNVFVSKDENLAINLFEDEHLTITTTSSGYNKNVFDKIKKISNDLSDKISFAYNDQYGYLMSDLSKIGAGIVLDCEICLPSLKELNKIEQIKQNIRQLGYVLKETNNPMIYKLSTICNLGYSEKEIYEEFDKMIQKIQDLEVESAKMLDVTNHDVILDRTVRSLAILNSCHLLTTEELKKLLINLRTGANLGMLDLNCETLNQLQLLTNSNSAEFISQTETKELAEKVRKILKGE